MAQTEGVSEFVDRLFQQALAQQSLIPLQSIEFLPKAVRGYDRAGPAQLGFPKHILEDGDVQINIRDRE